MLFAERDEDGRVTVRPKSEGRSDEEVFLRTGVRRFLPRWRARELWDEACRKAAEGSQP